MHPPCHRCHGDLPVTADPTTFCPHCGAPQLFLAEESRATNDAADSTGAAPPPPARETDWKAALTAAAAVALVAFLLTLVGIAAPDTSFLVTVWTLTASITTLALYQWRRPTARMDAGTGARIGLTAGLLSVAALAMALAAAGVVARFGLHALAPFDLGLAEMLRQVRTTAAAAPSQPPAEVLALYEIPEFQAGLLLTSLTLIAAFLLLFSTCGGALAGMVRTRRQNPA